MKQKLIYMMCMISVLFMVVGCSKEKEDGIALEQEGTNDDGKVELTMWTYYDGWDEVIKGFEEKYPNVTVKVKKIDNEKIIDQTLEALVGKDVPDILVLDSEHFGQFNGIEGLVDLNKEPFTAEKYKKDFPGSLWDVGMSYDKKRLIGIPFATAPRLTYYRADVMEHYGFPSDPEELGVYMADSANWLKMARTFKKDGKYIANWVADPVSIHVAGQTGFFNENLNYTRNTEELRKALAISKEIYSERLISYLDIWNQGGQKAIQEDKIPMLYLGTWGAGQLEQWVPEQAGKWRATRLPFGVYGWSNATLMSITEKSKHQKEAWDFIQYYVVEGGQKANVGTIPGYLPSRNNPEIIDHRNEFLGGQKDQLLFEQLMSKTKELSITPLDSKAFKIWTDNLNEGIEEEHDVDTIMATIESKINSELSKDKELLLNSKK